MQQGDTGRRAGTTQQGGVTGVKGPGQLRIEGNKGKKGAETARKALKVSRGGPEGCEGEGRTFKGVPVCLALRV
jgi:hypothetical protein